MTGTDALRRGPLVTPATSARMIEKAAALACDAVVLDLEDAVAPAMKAAARDAVRHACATMRFDGKELGVRINGVATPYFLDDVCALQGLPLDTVIVPKVERPEDVVVVEAVLRQLEMRPGGRAVTLQALIESARGLEAAAEIARASDRLAALVFGAGDFTADTGIAFTPAALHYARSRIVVAAAAARVQAIDHVHPAVADLAGLRRSAEEGRELGFHGKWAIHPGQVAVINEVWAPSEAEVAEARRVIEAYETAKAAGQGAISVAGSLVDEAVLKVMQRRAAIAKRLGR